MFVVGSKISRLVLCSQTPFRRVILTGENGYIPVVHIRGIFGLLLSSVHTHKKILLLFVSLAVLSFSQSILPSLLPNKLKH